MATIQIISVTSLLLNKSFLFVNNHVIFQQNVCLHNAASPTRWQCKLKVITMVGFKKYISKVILWNGRYSVNECTNTYKAAFLAVREVAVSWKSTCCEGLTRIGMLGTLKQSQAEEFRKNICPWGFAVIIGMLQSYIYMVNVPECQGVCCR